MCEQRFTVVARASFNYFYIQLGGLVQWFQMEVGPSKGSQDKSEGP